MPKRYLCVRAGHPFELDGRLDKPFWADAPWTDDFIDIQGEHMPSPRFRTRAKMLWDDQCFYIGAELQEPHVWGTLTEHDSVIFLDNDFEVFIDPDGDNHLYAEFEMNALNTTWDLLLVRPYRDGGPAIDGFELAGIRTAVAIDGTLNNPEDEDRGWSLEIAIPWRAFKDIAGVPCPPRTGDQWRLNFSRVEWEHEIVDGQYRKVPGKAEDNWVWSPQGVIDMHRPEMWGIVQFADTVSDPLLPYHGETERARLMEVYQRQREYCQQTGRYALDSKELNLPADLTITSNGLQWTAALGEYTIDHESKLKSRSSNKS